MLGSVGSIAESLAASRILTQIGFFASVWAQVSLQVFQPRVCFVATLKLQHSPHLTDCNLHQSCQVLFLRHSYSCTFTIELYNCAMLLMETSDSIWHTQTQTDAEAILMIILQTNLRRMSLSLNRAPSRKLYRAIQMLFLEPNQQHQHIALRHTTKRE